MRGNVDEDDDNDGNSRHYHFGDKITHIILHTIFRTNWWTILMIGVNKKMLLSLPT